ncbi:MAG: ATP-binding protein [archaeon]
MNENEFKLMLSQKENKDLDFKSELPDAKKVAQLVLAFYNSRGGKIVVGVEDESRKPIGLDDAEKTEHKFVQIIRHWCKLDREPEIEFVKFEGRDFVVAHCPKGENTPYFVRGEHVPRVRIGSSNMPANKEEIARLYREGSQKSQDAYPVENATLDDVDLVKVKEYFSESKLTGKLDEDDFFKLIEKEHLVARENGKLIPTIAGLILFGKHPSLEMPSTIIRADRYKGLDVSMWIDRADLEGDAFALVDDARKFMLRNMRTSYTPKGFKTEIKTEYPIEALKEAIINAVVHRDYHIRESVLIKMFDDRVEIWSPGELLRPLTISQLLDLTYSPKSRNETIATVFSRRKLMDKRGTGILRMNKFCDEYNLPHPVFVEQTGYFGIVFRNPDYYTKAPEIKAELNDRQRKAVGYLAEHRTIKREEYANICACSAVTAKRDIAGLLSKGVIKRIGKTGRGVYYELIN